MGSVTIGTVDYDIYGTDSGANDYLAARIGAAANWTAETATTKAQALVSATRAIRQWLVKFGVDLDPAESVDEEIQQANYELAYELTQDNDLLKAVNTATTEKRLKAGSAEVEYFRGTSGGKFPVTVQTLLNNWLNAGGYVLALAQAAYGTDEESSLGATDYLTQY